MLARKRLQCFLIIMKISSNCKHKEAMLARYNNDVYEKNNLRRRMIFNN